jgi:iron complex transport system substrate-binding protein
VGSSILVPVVSSVHQGNRTVASRPASRSHPGGVDVRYKCFMRVVSLLASGTELLCALGEGDALVGRSHECDDPPWVARLPVVSRPTFDVTGPSAMVDRLVRDKLRAGQPLYEIDRARLDELSPDLVITQTHCDVCAIGPAAVAAAQNAHIWPGLENLRTIAMRGGSLEGILRDFILVADAVGCPERGQAMVVELRTAMRKWRDATAALSRPRVVCLEWTDPPFPMGNWGPELVELAGGTCVLGNPNSHSAAVPWQAVRDADPDVLVIAPCGFGLERALADAASLPVRPGWSDLRAVHDERVYVCDGNRYFNRSGPTVFATIALLAEMLHPNFFPPAHAGTAYRRWSMS